MRITAIALLLATASGPVAAKTIQDLAQEIPGAELLWEWNNHIYHGRIGDWAPLLMVLGRAMRRRSR